MATGQTVPRKLMEQLVEDHGKNTATWPSELQDLVNPSIEARQGPGVAASHRRLIALSSSSEIISSASRNLGHVNAAHLGRKQFCHAAHDRVGDRLRIVRAQTEVTHAERRARAEEDVAAPEAP